MYKKDKIHCSRTLACEIYVFFDYLKKIYDKNGVKMVH